MQDHMLGTPHGYHNLLHPIIFQIPFEWKRNYVNKNKHPTFFDHKLNPYCFQLLFQYGMVEKGTKRSGGQGCDDVWVWDLVNSDSPGNAFGN